MDYRITVTQGDISAGQPGKCGYCPVALAIRRALGALVSAIMVDMLWIHLWDAEGHWEIETPDEAGDFIAAFDKGLPVQPFEFTISL